MHVRRITELTDLDELREDWNRLAADVPFRRWEWMRTWWVHFGGRGELFVLVVMDEDQRTVGIAPWFVDTSLSTGRQIRFLGAGEVCSEYLSLLCDASAQPRVARAISEWLINAKATSPTSVRNDWDLLRLSGQQANDPALDCLRRELAGFSNSATVRAAANCWRVDVPVTWDAYLASRPNPYRRKMRRLVETMFETERAVASVATAAADQQRLFDTLVDLHQRRRASLHQRGCFSTASFRDFLREVVEQFEDTPHVFLAELKVDGQSAAAAIGFIFGNVNYVYQCGMLPELSNCQPGWLMNTFIIRHAIAEGLDAVDFLSGDQAYKAHLGAKPTPMHQLSIAAPRPLAWLRHRLLLGSQRLKHWLISQSSV